MIVIATFFQKLNTVSDLLRPLSKKHPLTVNMLKRPKLFQKEHESTFIIIFRYSEKSWIRKYLPELYVKS